MGTAAGSELDYLWGELRGQLWRRLRGQLRGIEACCGDGRGELDYLWVQLWGQLWEMS